jgi:hypothetical protein
MQPLAWFDPALDQEEVPECRQCASGVLLFPGTGVEAAKGSIWRTVSTPIGSLKDTLRVGLTLTSDRIPSDGKMQWKSSIGSRLVIIMLFCTLRIKSVSLVGNDSETWAAPWTTDTRDSRNCSLLAPPVVWHSKAACFDQQVDRGPKG